MRSSASFRYAFFFLGFLVSFFWSRPFAMEPPLFTIADGERVSQVLL